MSRFDKITKNLGIALVSGLVVLCVTDPAFAQAKTLGDMTNRLYNSLLSLQTFLSILSYIAGVFFSITGLQKLRDYVDEPDKSPALAALMRLGAAAFFIFAPTFANIIVDSITGNNVGEGALLTLKNVTTPNGGSGDGLDGALVRFVYDFAAPFLENLLPFFCYVAGIIFMMTGLKRLAMADGDGPQAPGGMGTIGTFIIAAALMAFGYIMYSLQGSLFGETTLYSNPIFKNATGTTLEERSNQAMWGVFIFLRVVGYISVIRGLFMMREVGEGGNVSMVSVSTHLIAGAMLANATSFVMVVQETFVKDPANYVLTK